MAAVKQQMRATPTSDAGIDGPAKVRSSDAIMTSYAIIAGPVKVRSSDAIAAGKKFFDDYPLEESLADGEALRCQAEGCSNVTLFKNYRSLFKHFSSCHKAIRSDAMDCWLVVNLRKEMGVQGVPGPLSIEEAAALMPVFEKGCINEHKVVCMMCDPTVVILKRSVPAHLEQWHDIDRSITKQWSVHRDFNKLNRKVDTRQLEFTNLWQQYIGDAEFEAARLNSIMRTELIDGSSEHTGSCSMSSPSSQDVQFVQDGSGSVLSSSAHDIGNVCGVVACSITRVDVAVQTEHTFESLKEQLVITKHPGSPIGKRPHPDIEPAATDISQIASSMPRLMQMFCEELEGT